MSYKEIFEEIYENFGFGGNETRSGPGSTLDKTKDLRERIVELVKEKEIKSVVDIPCGDFNWMKEIVDSFESYTGGDIVEEMIRVNTEVYGNSKTKFINFDLLLDQVPTADLVIVRDILGHLPIADGQKIVDNILNSGCKYLLSTTWAKKTDTGWKKCEPGDVHRENEGVDYGKFYPVNLMATPFNFPEPDLYLEENANVDKYDEGNRKVLALWEISKIKDSRPPVAKSTFKSFQDLLAYINILPREQKEQIITRLQEVPTTATRNENVTIVTGLWNIGRGELNSGFNRTYNDYLDRFTHLLRTNANMYIYISPEDEAFIWQHRSRENTTVKLCSLEELKSWFEFSSLTNTLRQRPEWTAQAGWLPDSPQATLEMYNPVVMSKMFLLNDASIHNPFNSDYFFWIDAGISSTVHPGYFYHDKVFDNLPNYCNQYGNFIFLSYPYIGGAEVHGFPREQLARYCQTDYVNYVCRGGFFGGRKDILHDINNAYYGNLSTSLREGLMGTEESIFTIIAHTLPNLVHRFELEDNGLVWPFFEKLKQYTTPVDPREVALYVITYNSPNQFEALCNSMELYDSDFLTKTRKYLLNNSLDRSTDAKYAELCAKYDFEEIKKDNLGICGGRQFIAEHFAKTPYEFCIFYEDDMFFYAGPDTVCKNGFPRKIPNFFNKVLEISKQEKYDFLKFNFTEFFGDNSTQWSWYNVPQSIRQEIWPNNCTLPVHGQSKNAPKTVYKHIKSYNELAYVDGEIYYCNWPQIVSKEGNRKMFLDTKWDHPFEQTWMSYMFQETRKGNIKPALLLATPTEHNRFEHYQAGERKEH